MIELDKDYADLLKVLDKAYRQAAEGKGKQRHARGRPFKSQSIMEDQRLFGSPVGALTQVRKKALESQRLFELYGGPRAAEEMLGAIVNAAAAALWYWEQPERGQIPLLEIDDEPHTAVYEAQAEGVGLSGFELDLCSEKAPGAAG